MDRYAIIVLSLLVFSCSPTDEDPAQTCTSGKCDGVSESEFKTELTTYNDPIAKFLVKSANDDGTIEGDYSTFLDGIGEEMGCGKETEKTFTILMSNKDNFPRNMVTRCSDDALRASEFALSTQSDNGDLSDINPYDFKMVAWDKSKRRYNLYEAKPSESGEDLTVVIQPDACVSCHTQSTRKGAPPIEWTPVMNELTNPWTLWNAEPDFRSHRFDDLLNPNVADGEIYQEMTKEALLGAASDFELITRRAIDRVVSARLRTRREEADVEKALNLLYPLFCDESANYASENHESGEVSTAIVIDDALRYLYLQIRAEDWPYDWLNDGRLRLRSVENELPPMSVMPVRGESTLQVEVGLVSRGTLAAEDVIALRSLDYKRPVFSEFRCNLYETTADRLRRKFVVDPDEYAKVSDLLPVFFSEMMQMEDGDGNLQSLIPDNGDVFAIALIDASTDVDAIYAGQKSIDDFAAELEVYFDEVSASTDRQVLESERVRRGCLARELFQNAPQIPDITCL